MYQYAIVFPFHLLRHLKIQIRTLFSHVRPHLHTHTHIYTQRRIQFSPGFSERFALYYRRRASARSKKNVYSGRASKYPGPLSILSIPASVVIACGWKNGVLFPLSKHKTVAARNVHFYSFSLCESMNKFALCVDDEAAFCLFATFFRCGACASAYYS